MHIVDGVGNFAEVVNALQIREVNDRMVFSDYVETSILGLVFVEEKANWNVEQIWKFIVAVGVELEQLSHEGWIGGVKHDFLLKSGAVLHLV